MDSTIMKSGKDTNDWWNNKKQELLEGIDAVMEKGNLDQDILEIMKSMVKNAKVRNSIVGYYEEKEDKEVK